MIGQKAVDGKSNEITAIPELLESLALAGAVITIDAMGAQRSIAAAILEKEADYVLALKGNQGTLHEDVRLFFEEKSREVNWRVHDSLDAGHGRIEERRCRVTSDIAWLQERHAWPGLRSIAEVQSRRTDKKTGAVNRETRYYITSLLPDAEYIGQCIRSHWAIENNLHWALDVTFREDQCRSRKDHVALNFATMRHAALNLLKQNNARLSLKKKQRKASLNQEFRTQLILC